MKRQFWFSFFISLFACVLTAFFIGLLMVKTQEAKSRKSFLKRTIQLESLFYLEDLEKKFDSWATEVERIQRESFVSSSSPFFALVLTDQEKIHVLNQILNREEKEKSLKKQDESLVFVDEKATKELTENQNVLEEIQAEDLILFSEKIMKEGDFSEGFLLKKLKGTEQQKNIVIFMKVLEGKVQWLAFFKADSQIFQLQPALLKNRTAKDREFFLVNSKGKIFFHSNKEKVFKKLSKKSLLWKSFENMSNKVTKEGSYIKLKKRGGTDIYYIQKWLEGEMFLISKAGMGASVVDSSVVDSSVVWYTCFLLFILSFIVFIFKLFSLASAYKFLKFAFLSFEKTSLMPPLERSKNPLLYFYSNRQLFFKHDTDGEFSEEKVAHNVTFQDIINQEAEKTKLKFPGLDINKKYSYDVRLFGFEKFLRTVTHELLSNAIEAMGGLEKLKVDVSLSKQTDNLVFCIRDYGSGVSDQNYDKLFEMYYSTKSQMGVGLNLVQSIIRSNEGSIKMSSPQGGGLEVCIHLPLKSFLKNHSAKESV